MKNTFSAILWTVLFSSILSCSDSVRKGNHNISVSISESEEEYQLSALYNTDKTQSVQKYINEQTEPNELFTSVDDELDATTTLKDQTKFHIQSSPGKLKITIDKRVNADASLARIKTMCEGIKSIIAKK